MSGETPIPSRIEISATHITPKGELHLGKPAQTLSISELRHVRELKQGSFTSQPDGPKHVLQEIQEMGVEKRSNTALQKIKDLGSPGGKDIELPEVFENRRGLNIKLDEIAQRKNVREGFAVDRPLVETPHQIGDLLSKLQKSGEPPDRIKSLSVVKQTISIESRNGIVIILSLPTQQGDESKVRENRLTLQIISETPNEYLDEVKNLYTNRNGLLDITDAIVTLTGSVAESLPEEVRIALELKQREDREMEKKVAWRIDPYVVSKKAAEVDQKKAPEKALAQTPDQLAEKIKNPAYLPTKAEISSAFKGQDREAFQSFCEERGISEFYTQEFINSMSGYLIDQAMEQQRHMGNKQRAVRILTAGETNDPLAQHILNRLRSLSISKDQVIVVAGGNGTNQHEKLKEVIEMNRPDIIVYNWMGYGDDVSPVIRQEDVSEYILVGEGEGGTCGSAETWSNHEGYDMTILNSLGSEPGAVDGQVGKTDILGQTERTGTFSFKRQKTSIS